MCPMSLLLDPYIRSAMISEKYFEMNKKQAREALDIYKRFLVRMERVSEFLKVAEVGFGSNRMQGIWMM